MMTALLSPALMLLFAAPMPDKDGQARQTVQYGIMTYRQRIVIRVPKLPNPPRAPQQIAASPIRWKEMKADKCLAIGSITGVAVSRTESVDLLTIDGRRLRAKFDDDCPAIDFYAGLYIRRTIDGMICAKRDAIRSRSGDSCRIEAFRELRRKR
ncbi:MAG: hypothetical protein BVN33_16645 [Proteobacteria bacterium ST_bin13]|nr:MAG: hypothetical protein BVN33_16645 [Proteobacteria bacterium ST_bin13]